MRKAMGVTANMNSAVHRGNPGLLHTFMQIFIRLKRNSNSIACKCEHRFQSPYETDEMFRRRGNRFSLNDPKAAQRVLASSIILLRVCSVNVWTKARYMRPSCIIAQNQHTCPGEAFETLQPLSSARWTCFVLASILRVAHTQLYSGYDGYCKWFVQQQQHQSLINTSLENSQIKSKKGTNDSAALVIPFNWSLPVTFVKAQNPEMYFRVLWQSCQGPLSHRQDPITTSDHTQITLPGWNRQAKLHCSQLNNVLLSIYSLCQVRIQSCPRLTAWRWLSHVWVPTKIKCILAYLALRDPGCCLGGWPVWV